MSLSKSEKQGFLGWMWLIYGVIFSIVMFAFICPYLISANSDFKLFMGVIIFILSFFIDFLIFKRAYMSFKKTKE